MVNKSFTSRTQFPSTSMRFESEKASREGNKNEIKVSCCPFPITQLFVVVFTLKIKALFIILAVAFQFYTLIHHRDSLMLMRLFSVYLLSGFT